MEGEVQIAIIILIVLVIAIWVLFTYRHQAPTMSFVANPEKERVHDLLSKMQRLWTEHAYLMRMEVIETITGYLGANVTAEKLQNNTQQIGRNFGNLYGSTLGDQFANLLQEHNMIAKNLITLAKQNKDVSSVYTQWKENANKITNFVTSVNPNISRSSLSSLLDAHLDSMLKEMNYTLRHENLASMASFDSYLKNTYDLVDTLQEGTWKHLCGHGPRYIKY